MMPHLMNCPHTGEGWCLDCVKEQHAELSAALAQVAGLKREVDVWTKTCQLSGEGYEKMRGERDTALAQVAEIHRAVESTTLGEGWTSPEEVEELKTDKASAVRSLIKTQQERNAALAQVANLEAQNMRYVKHVGGECDALKKQVAAMRGALEGVMLWIDSYHPPFTDDDEWPATEQKVKQALANPPATT